MWSPSPRGRASPRPKGRVGPQPESNPSRPSRGKSWAWAHGGESRNPSISPRHTGRATVAGGSEKLGRRSHSEKEPRSTPLDSARPRGPQRYTILHNPTNVHPFSFPSTSPPKHHSHHRSPSTSPVRALLFAHSHRPYPPRTLAGKSRARARTGTGYIEFHWDGCAPHDEGVGESMPHCHIRPCRTALRNFIV